MDYIQKVDTIDDLRAITGVSIGHRASTSSYHKLGDGGGGDYYVCKIATTRVDNGGTIIFGENGNTIWKLIHHGSVDVLQFGAKGDATADDTQSIQAAIDCALKGDIHSVTFSSNRRYRITDSLFIGETNGVLTRPFVLRGVSIKPAQINRAATIIPDFADRPALIIQGARGLTITGLLFNGKNNILNDLQNGTMDILHDHSKFIKGEARTHKYSPYSAICIDPYFPKTAVKNNDLPPGSPDWEYSDPSNPMKHSKRYDDYKTANGSARVVIDGCTFYNFVVGVMINPSPFHPQGEEITIRQCVFEGHRDCIGVGQSQSRDCSVENCRFVNCRTVVNGVSYGKQEGVMPDFVGGDVAFCQKLFMCHSERGGGNISGLYAEAFHSIGTLGNLDVRLNNAVNFSGCQLNFFLEESVVCDLRIDSVGDSDDKEKLISIFRDELESKAELESNKAKCAVLILDATIDGTKGWTIAGFSDEDKFEEKLIRDPTNELVIELNRNKPDRNKIILLATSFLNRTIKSSFKAPEFHLLARLPVVFSGCSFGNNGDAKYPFIFYTDNDAYFQPSISFQSCSFGISKSEASIVTNDINKLRFSECTIVGTGDIKKIKTLGNLITNEKNVNRWKSICSHYAVPGAAVTVGEISYKVCVYDPWVDLGSLTENSPGFNASTASAAFRIPTSKNGLVKLGDDLFSMKMEDSSLANDCPNDCPNDWPDDWPDYDIGKILGIKNNLLGVKNYNYLYTGHVSHIDRNDELGDLITVTHIPYSISCFKQLGNHIGYFRKFHTPTFGDVNAGSNEIINVSPNPIGLWQKGDRIMDNDGAIEKGTYVDSVSKDRITISKSSNSTLTAIDLFDAKVTPVSRKSLGKRHFTTSEEHIPVEHGLGYRPSVVEITMNSSGTVYQSMESDEQNIYLSIYNSIRSLDEAQATIYVA